MTRVTLYCLRWPPRARLASSEGIFNHQVLHEPDTLDLDGGNRIVPVRKPSKWRTLRSHFTLETAIASIRVTSTKKIPRDSSTDEEILALQERIEENVTTISVTPASWLVDMGLTYGLRLGLTSLSVNGWKNTLETFRPQPDNARIFELSKSGNIDGIMERLREGLSSVRDVDSRGRTPLHVGTGMADLVFSD